ncbi:TonB-dependent hemoglobin/transferrin/lactoferrin family receptor [Vibrio aquaticus]|uniref:TonB-dependent hemoglobin/transferrin/lactoferrin family receptor n=1 Tax=Vibrio aquaticus TaxID=2496559 RepID=A0A432D093_9VIBR|nr:TonB-dependent hemoglobin/transferrin/lactoferrin family receptor [Vibrio aquaticus]RTZ17340.1 TonB-dependent hemoglobin/transferrin/lactoferrin family receptor [Vibrio aquaticus]
MYKQTLLSASIVLALTSTAHAEEYALFDEVVVSATRTEQQLEDVAGSVSVVTEEDIDKNLAKDLADAFKYTPGVSVETDSRHGIQGINIRGLGGNRVNILVDGVAQPARYNSGYSFLQSSRVMTDTEMFKSVEIVKGSASSLYGSDGIAGIAAFQTKDPSDFVSDDKQLGGYVKLGYASDTNEFSESVALANKFGDLETLVAYTRRDGDEVDNFGTPDEQDSSSDNLLVKVQYQVNDENRIELVGEYGQKQTETQLEKTGQTFLSDFGGMPPSFRMGLGNIDWDQNYGNDESEQTRLGFKHILEKDLTIADKLEWGIATVKKDENGNTHRNGEITSVSPIAPGSPTPDLPTGDDALRAEHKDYTYNEKSVQVDIQATKYIETASVQHTIVYGANYQTKDIENRNYTRNLIDSSEDKLFFYQPNAEETRYGAFVQDEMLLLNETLRLTPGIRFDSFETTPDVKTEGIDPSVTYDKHSSSAVTARLGAVYDLNESWKTFAQISQGFRAPSFDELYYSYDGGSSYENRPNPQLEAEESITYEIGFRHNTEFSSSEIAFYYSDFTNFIDNKVVEEGVGSNPDIYQYVNVDEAIIKGVELGNTLDISAMAGIKEGITSRFAIAYTEGEDGNGNALNSIEPWNAVVALNYDAPTQNWGTSIQLSYIAKKSNSDLNLDSNNGGTTDQVENPSATVVDLTAYYVPVKDLTLRAGLFNVTDEKYWAWDDVRGRTELDLDDTQAGRNWAITAKYEF